MTNQDMDYLARKIVGLERKHSALARARQLPSSSIKLVDGTDVQLSDTAEDAQDNRNNLIEFDRRTAQQGDIADAEAIHSVAVPDWITGANDAADGAWDVTQYAVDLAHHLETELGPLPGQIQEALDDAAEALEEAGLARSAAADAITAASEAVADAAQAITDAAAAATAAAAAQTTANGKSEVVRSPNPATAAGSYQQGDQWWQFDGPDIVGLWLHDGTDWVPQALTDAIIATLDAAKITTGTLAADRIGALSITAAKIAAEAITTEKIAALAVTAAQLAADSVTAMHIAAGSVVTEKLAAGAVATDKLDALAVTSEKIAVGAVIAEKIAALAITAEHIAAGAIDAMEIRGVQIYGGYIEAPVIASSSTLGSGANTLNDPGFQSTVNTAWVLSGHSGDAATTQRDSYWWDQSYSQKNLYPPDTWTVMRNTGNSHVDLTLTPAVRECGSLVFANYSWKPANRTLTDPFTFTNRPDWSSGYGGGATDPSWAAPAAPTPLTATASTSYLTNSATVAVQSGQRWNIRLEFWRLMATNVDLIDLTVEIINASNSAVLYSRLLLEDEKLAGRVNDWWDSTFTGNVKYRIKSVYRAGGGSATRKPALTGTATQYRAGNVQTTWSASPSNYLPYGGTISTYQSLGSTAGAKEIERRAVFRVSATSAMFAQVQPQKGWRLTEESGFELFNSLGARTGKLDGEDNYLNGKFGTKESGARAAMENTQFFVTDVAGNINGQLYSTGSASVVSTSEVRANGRRVYGDDIANLAYALTLTSGTTIHESSWLRKREDGYVYGTLAFYRSAGFTSGATFASLNTGWRPVGGDQLPAVMWGSGSPGRAHFQIGGVANGALIVWSPPANTQYVSAKVSFITV